MAARPTPPARDDYRVFRPILTRWSDNDAYGHVNNVRYYSFFDTIVNGHLIESDVLRVPEGTVIGLVVETKCSFFSQTAFPEPLTGGLRVDRIGTSSVQYGIAIFRDGEVRASAAGHFIHVYVNRDTHLPGPLPADLRAELERLLVT